MYELKTLGERVWSSTIEQSMHLPFTSRHNVDLSTYNVTAAGCSLVIRDKLHNKYHPIRAVSFFAHELQRRTQTSGNTALTEWKRNEEHLYSAIYTMHSRKALRHWSHSLTCNLHHACLSFACVHQMAPPLTQVADIQLQLTTHLMRNVILVDVISGKIFKSGVTRWTTDVHQTVNTL